MVLPRAPKALFTTLAILSVLFLLVGCGKDSIVNPRLGPSADFTATPLSGDQPLDVTFTDLSIPGSSDITSWFWEFGDGVTSTLKNAGHLYAQAGIYTVSLRVTTSDGTDREIKTDYITVTKAGQLPPNAAFTADRTTGGPGTPVHFTDQSSPGSAIITGYAWNFGDGGTSTAPNPTHTYTASGTFTVTLSVATSVGSDTETKTDYITIAPTKPTAAFTATPTVGQTPLLVTFTDQSLTGGNPITSWLWTFGDGGTSTLQSPTHTYTTTGTFTVALTVTNSLGTDTVTRTSLITTTTGPVPPIADFSGTPTSGTAPLTVQFTDASTAGSSPITSRLWTFGDGTTSTEENPSHTYTTPGNYEVVLQVHTDVGDDSESKLGYIQVQPAPVVPTVDFSGNPTNGFLPLTVAFSDLSANGGAPITDWAWDFGDGGTSTLRNPSHTYNTEGTFTVTLSATNAAGTGTLTKTGYIVVGHVPVAPVAEFSGTPTSGDAPLTVNFTDQSTPGSAPITAWSWDFGDGGSSTAQSPSHTFTTPGSYTVALSVTTADGADTEAKGFYVVVSTPPTVPTANFSGNPTAGFAPLTVQFTDLSANGGSAITAWSWNFGDGATSTQQNPTHVYALADSYTVTLTVTNAVGPDSEIKTNYIVASNVPLAPTAAFTGTPTSGDAPLTVSFTDQSTPGTAPITARLWDFGDGATSTAQNPSHTYTNPGSYTVTLQVTTLVGDDSESKSSYITVNTPATAPTANFGANQTTGFAPLTVQFSDLSTNGGSPITSWSWSFGDGGTSTLQNPSHTFAAPGSYTVTLTATNGVGSDSETKTNYIVAAIVPVGPTADFSGTPTSGDAPLTVNFTDLSTPGTSPITSWAWDFGDGGTSTAQNPSHTYSTPGSYSVTLTVTTSVGGDIEAKGSYVAVSVPPTTPTANFSADQTAGFAPLTVNFTDLSTNGGSPITARLWSFGDGSTSIATNPSHTYALPGSYDVTLRVTNAVGTDSTTKADYITAAVVPVGPVADFTGSPTSGDAPLTVNFTDLSTPGTSPITTWSWNFGDGGTSTAQNPSHTYNTPGGYGVTLTVTTTVGGDTEAKGSFIQVSVPPTVPTANFTADQTAGFAPLTVQFTDISTNGGSTITGWSWNFGDGGTSTQRNPSHTFTVPGTYTVTLTATNAVGSDPETKSNYITAAVVPVPPVAAFSGTPLSGDAPLTVNFTDQSNPGTAPITGRLWDFGDGATSTTTNPTHTYTTPGTYTVSLGVSTSAGDDTEIKTDYVVVSVPPTAPTANFTGSPTGGFAPLTVQFTDASTNGGLPITARFWTFGDGGTSTAQNPSHTYNTPGSYDVKLRVTNAVGPDSLTRADYIVAAVVPVGPVADFTGTPLNGDAPLTVNFTDTSSPGTSPITGRLWDFGDGGSSTAQNPSHTYTTPGTYTVTLGVSTAVGDDTENKGSYVTVDVPPTVPTANFTADQTAGFAPLTVQFTDTSTNGGSPITGRSWTFGDGGTSTATNPSHTYTTPGTYTVTLTATNAVGSDGETKTGYITASVVPVGPTADFSGTPLSGDAPLTVNFTDASTPGTSPITGRLWDFGDGGTSTATNPSHTYNTPGTYTVTLGVSTAVGDDTESKGSYVVVSVPPTAPTANFSGDVTSGFAPLTVTFTDQSTNGGSPITSRLWTFGDGGTSTALNPSHTYTTPGTYDVKLRVTNAVGPDSLIRDNYIVASATVPPVADFTGTPTSGDAPLTVNFTDASNAGSSPITSRSWTFGDGGTSTATNPSHTYTNPGTYNVTLTVTTNHGTDGETKNGYIQADVPATVPSADFTADETSGFAPLTVTFTDQSTNGGSPITSRLWTFGDGGTSTAQNPTHTYTDPGSYDVKLRVANAVGPDSTTKSSYITASATAPPVADFTGTPTSGDAPLTVDFTDASTAGTAPISSRLWTFGDGGTSTAANPSHVYTTPGTYNVTLSVTTAHGTDGATKNGYIQVGVPPTPPTADFSADATSGFAPLTVNFTDESTSGGSSITSWSWSFGDGGTSSAQSPSHTYNDPGSYDVTLRVENAVGPDSTTKSSYITASATAPPVSDFTAAPTDGVTPLTVTFTEACTPGTSPITSWLWNFGDGTTSNAANPSHTYTNPGTYNVTLSVTTAHGNNGKTKNGYVHATTVPPVAAFSGSPRSGGAPLTVQFSDASTAGTSPITSRAWDFGDGATSNQTNPEHTYNATGAYDVSLTVTTDDGTDTETKTSYVIAAVPPTTSFVAFPDSGFAPLAVGFTDQSTDGGAAITGWAWTFGDGASSSAQNPNHTYANPGTYTVTLTATNIAGSTAFTRTAYIFVAPPPVPPTAAFTAAPRNGVAPLLVQFSDSSEAGDAPITARHWDFGDGATSSEASPSHTYASPGLYTVVLQVLAGDGTEDVEDKNSYVQVSAAPSVPLADFGADPTTGGVPLNVQFTDLSSNGGSTITSWSWAFGDGAVSTEQSPSHTYTTPGDYTVSLTATNGVGSHTETKNAYITATNVPVPPTADFTGSPVRGGPPLQVQFTDASAAGSAPITGRLWDFGDGTTSTATNPAHTFSTIGSYTIGLAIVSPSGEDTETKTFFVQVCQPTAAAFTADTTNGIVPFAVQFQDGSTPAPGIDSWHWDFGDGSTSTSQNPSHTYTVPGTYAVKLTVDNGCVPDSVIRTAFVTSCANPTYTIAGARWDTVTDDDENGFRSRARLVWNADSDIECSRSVFGRVWYHDLGDTVWTSAGESACYTITSDSPGDTRAMFVQGLPTGCYEFRIDLFECGGTEPVATLLPTGDPDLSNVCFEPTDASPSAQLSGTSP